MKITKHIAAAAICIAAAAAAAAGAHAQSYSALLSCTEPVMTVNDTVFQTQGTPFLYKNNTYVPVDDLLKSTGFSLGWDSDIRAVIAYKDGVYSYIIVNSDVLWVGENRYTVGVPTLYYKNVLYMPLTMYAQLSDSAIYFDGVPETIKKGYRDLLGDTYISDDYRLPYSGVGTYRGVTLVGTRGMELLHVTDSAAQSYASMVNAVADAMPESVSVYNIALPTACEFYAPKQLYTNQTAGIKKIYSLLNDRVTPINAVKPLMEHAAEKIYFDTDHHWTQRGAYYAYREFIQIRGDEIPPLESFDKTDYWAHVGSFASFMSGTNGASVMRANPELLERFIPKVESSGAAFVDMYMTQQYYTPSAVDTNAVTYGAFMGGDCPVTRFTTGTRNGRKICIIKDSFGTAFASWALNNYEEIYIIDPREFNGFNGHYRNFSLLAFYDMVHFDDLVTINYPGSLSSGDYRQSVLNMIK